MEKVEVKNRGPDLNKPPKKISVEEAKNRVERNLKCVIGHNRFTFLRLLPLQNLIKVRVCHLCDNNGIGNNHENEKGLRFVIFTRENKGKTQFYSVCDKCGGLIEEANGIKSPTTKKAGGSYDGGKNNPQ